MSFMSDMKKARVDESLMDRAALLLQYVDEREARKTLEKEGASRQDAYLAVKAGKLLNETRQKNMRGGNMSTRNLEHDLIRLAARNPKVRAKMKEAGILDRLWKKYKEKNPGSKAPPKSLRDKAKEIENKQKSQTPEDEAKPKSPSGPNPDDSGSAPKGVEKRKRPDISKPSELSDNDLTTALKSLNKDWGSLSREMEEAIRTWPQDPRETQEYFYEKLDKLQTSLDSLTKEQGKRDEAKAEKAKADQAKAEAEAKAKADAAAKKKEEEAAAEKKRRDSLTPEERKKEDEKLQREKEYNDTLYEYYMNQYRYANYGKVAYKPHPLQLSASKTLWKPLLQLRFSGWQLASEDFWNRKPVSREGFNGVWEKRFEIPQIPRRGWGDSEAKPWATSNRYGVSCSVEADDQGNAKAIMSWHGPGMFGDRTMKRKMYTQIFPYAITGEGRQVSLSKDLIIWVQKTFKKVEKDIAVFVKEDREKALDHEYQRNRLLGRYANELIRIAHDNPELRAKLLPLIRTASVVDRTASTKTAQSNSMLKEILGKDQYRKLARLRYNLHGASPMSTQTANLLMDVIEEMADRFRVDQNTMYALNKMRNLDDKMNADMARNQIFKIADLLGMKLPNGIFATLGEN